MIPTPQRFMSPSYTPALSKYKDIGAADRNSDSIYMQAAVLDTIVYPTGGYTTYEYETNSIAISDYTQSLEYEEFLKRGYDVNILKTFSYTPSVPAGVNPVSNVPYNFTLKEELPFTLSVRCSGVGRDGQSFNVVIVGGSNQRVIPLTFKSSTEFNVVLQDKLPAGNYQLIIGAPSTGNDYGISCRLQGNYPSSTFSNLYPQKKFNRRVGGLRVKRINNYDNDNSLINYITYDYNTSGVLLENIGTIDYHRYTYIYNEGHRLYGAAVEGDNEASAEVYTFTSGRPLFSAFYAACNPGIVGYSKVTKCKYNPKGNDPEKTVITTFKNVAPQNIVIDYYQDFSNGKVITQETLDANKKVRLKVENTYNSQRLKHYAINMDSYYELILAGGLSGINNYNGNGKNYDSFSVWRYPYILSRDTLAKSVTTEYCQDGKTIIKTKEYSYNPRNHQVSQIEENTSLSNQTQRTKIIYSSDGTDVASRGMKNQHRLNDVVENKIVLVDNGKERCIRTQRTNYTSRSRKGTLRYLPGSLSISIGNATIEERAKYSYDDSLNVRSIVTDGVETVYIWSYSGQYPVAKIEGSTYAEVEAAVGKTKISDLLKKTAPTDADLNSIRTTVNAKGGYVTTYIYKPLVGILAETLPNGQTIKYEYDGFGRLTKVIDHNGKAVQTNSYNYNK